MSRSRTLAFAPLWLLLVAALLVAGAAALRGQLVAPSQHQVLLGPAPSLESHTAPTQAQSRPASESGPADPSSQQPAAQPSRVQVPSQVLVEAKGAERQPPASQTCGSNPLEVCPDQ